MSQLHSVVPQPGYEVPGLTRKYRIRDWETDATAAERIRSLSHILGAELAELANDQVLARAINEAEAQLLPTIGRALDAGKEGFLLRINLYREPVGGALRPSAQLLSAIGTGAEPIDALAESYRIGAIEARQQAAEQIRRYRWCWREDAALSISCMDVALERELERLAWIEARRRQVLGVAFDRGVELSIAGSTRASEWLSMLETHQARNEVKERRGRMIALGNAFKASEQRFDRAFLAYRRAERELSAARKRAAVFDTLSMVLGVFRTAVETARGAAPDSTHTDQSADWQRHQIRVLEEVATRNQRLAQELGTELVKLDAQLRNEWIELGQTPRWGELVLPDLH